MNRHRIIRLVCIMLVLSLSGCFAACKKRSEVALQTEDYSENSSSEESSSETYEEETTESIEMTVDTSVVESESSEETEVVETSETYGETSVSGEDFVLYTQPSQPSDYYIIQDYSSFILPEHGFAAQRVTMDRSQFLMGMGTVDIIGTQLEVHYSYHDFESGQDVQIDGPFVLEGISVPSDYSIQWAQTVPQQSYSNICNALLYNLTVFIDSDNVPDENGYYHGYIYFTPKVDRNLYGYTLESEDLVQLNEFLLAYGFAGPDPEYTGPYADIYAQYPALAEDYTGYPIFQPFCENGLDIIEDSVAFYDPSIYTQYYGDMYEP